MSFIGIDIGTSFIKGATLDLKTCRYEHVFKMPFPDPIPLNNPLFCEFDAKAILEEVNSLVQALASTISSCDGIVMCTQMASMVLVSEQGDVLSNCIGWRDQRASMRHPSEHGSYYEMVKARIDVQQRSELGNELPMGAPACFLFWLAENRKLRSEATPVSLADFILGNLCKTRPTVDATNAMAYGLLNLEDLQWHWDVIRQIGLDQIHWPTIVGDGHVVGYASLGGKQIPCYAPVGDYQCALAGAMVDSTELSLNISTGSQVSRITDFLEKGDYQSRPFFGQRFVNTISHLPAGRSLNIFVELLTEIKRGMCEAAQDPWAYIAEAASSIDETDLDVNIGFFHGPCGNRGYISNISERNLTVGSLFRASFLNMANNFYSCALKIWPERTWDTIVISGGLGRKLPLLRQMIQQRFQSGMRLCQVEEDTLLGLMILAMVYSGQATSLKDATQKVSERNNVVD